MSAEDLATFPFGSAIIISQRNKPYLTTFANFWDFMHFKPSEPINNIKSTILSCDQILYNFMASTKQNYNWWKIISRIEKWKYDKIRTIYLPKM